MSRFGESTQQNRENSLIRLTGEFVAKHREQLLELARMSERAAISSGDSRILSISNAINEIRVETSSASLAEKIGERVSAVCGGSVQHDPSSDGHATCLIWSRSESRKAK